MLPLRGCSDAILASIGLAEEKRGAGGLSKTSGCCQEEKVVAMSTHLDLGSEKPSQMKSHEDLQKELES